MTNEQYQNMLDMLISATRQRKLDWEDNGGHYKALVGDCSIQLAASYDFEVEENVYTLSLFNSKGQKFAAYYSSGSSANENMDYEKLNQLYSTINDSIYRITESENCILSKLDELTRTL